MANFMDLSLLFPGTSLGSIRVDRVWQLYHEPLLEHKYPLLPAAPVIVVTPDPATRAVDVAGTRETCEELARVVAS